MAATALFSTKYTILLVRAAVLPEYSKPRAFGSRSLPSGYRSLSSTTGKASLPALANWPSTHDPSPYDVLRQSRSTPYSKHNFTELAKLYHPDRHQFSTDQSLSAEVVIERFCMIMDAHNILSDPVKRQAYDANGIGWRFAPKPITRTDQWPAKEPYDDQYDDQHNKNQEEVFVWKLGSAVTMLLLIAVTSWLQLMRATKMSREAALAHHKIHQAVSEELRKLYEETASLSKEDRIRRFLGHREALLAGKAEVQS